MGKVNSWVMDMEEQIFEAVQDGAESIQAIASATGITDTHFIRQTVNDMYSYGDCQPIVDYDASPPAVYDIDDEIPF